MTGAPGNLFPVKSRRRSPSILGRGGGLRPGRSGGAVILDPGTIERVRSWLITELDGSGPLPVPRDDLVGDVILRLLVRARTEEIRNPLAYARVILKNLVRDHIHDLERARAALENLGRSRPVECPGDEAHYDDEQLVRRLLASAGLSAMEEKVIRMQYFDGMKECDIARELSRNPGTICNHRARALKKLARQAALRLEP